MLAEQAKSVYLTEVVPQFLSISSFTDQTHFTKALKRVTGATPKMYKDK